MNTLGRGVVLTAGIALCYFLLGTFGLASVPPHGFEPATWPAAGFVFAACIAGGFMLHVLGTPMKDIFALPKIEAFNVEPNRSPCDALGLVEDVAAPLRESAKAKGLTLLVGVVDTEARNIGDPIRLRQMLSNSVDSAIKFYEKGEIAIMVLEGVSSAASPAVPESEPQTVTTLDSAAHDAWALVVDDNIINRMVAQNMLLRLGVQVRCAEDGQSALDLLQAFATDLPVLVLMDCQMPVMDGYATTRAIRADEQTSNGPRLRIVALTAGAFESDRQQCLDAGMDDYIAKPLVFDQLAEIVKGLLT